MSFFLAGRHCTSSTTRKEALYPSVLVSTQRRHLTQTPNIIASSSNIMDIWAIVMGLGDLDTPNTLEQQGNGLQTTGSGTSHGTLALIYRMQITTTSTAAALSGFDVCYRVV